MMLLRLKEPIAAQFALCVTKLINSAKRVDAVTLNPSDNDQTRQTVIRKMISESVRASDQRSVLIVAIET